jgi:hypothetical protein
MDVQIIFLRWGDVRCGLIVRVVFFISLVFSEFRYFLSVGLLPIRFESRTDTR